MARKKIREYDSKRLLKENLKRLAGIDLTILSAQVSAPAPFPPFSSFIHPHRAEISPDSGMLGSVSAFAVCL
jgi:hypothetical protein